MSRNDENRMEQTLSGRFMKKGKESPFVIVGMVGFVVVCGISAYKFKDRKKMPISLWLIQTRVAAQGAVVGMIALGVFYQTIQNIIGTKEK